MRNMTAVVLVLLVLVGVGGCAGLGYPPITSSTGWSFQVGRPATVTTTTPTVLNQQSGPIGMQSIGALAGPSNSIIHTPPPPMGPAAEFYRVPFKDQKPFIAECGTCTLQDVCNKLDKVIDAVGAKREE